jgi:hypothetical protein
MERYVQCDCCDYFTIPDGEDYEICSICFWQQDAFGISEPNEESGANHELTLVRGRKNFLTIGACCEEMLKNVIPVQERENYKYAARHF